MSTSTPDKKLKSAGAGPEPTKGESQFLLSMIQHMPSVPDVDWAKFAAANNYNSATVAKNRFYNIKKRLGIMGGGGDGTSGSGSVRSTPSKPRAPRPATSAAATPRSAGKDKAGGGATPGSRRKRTKVAADLDDDDDDAELDGVIIKDDPEPTTPVLGSGGRKRNYSLSACRDNEDDDDYGRRYGNGNGNGNGRGYDYDEAADAQVRLEAGEV